MKINDSQLKEKLLDPKYPSYYALANSLGVKPAQTFQDRCHRLELCLGIEPRNPKRKGRPPTKPKEPKPVKVKIEKPKKIILPMNSHAWKTHLPIDKPIVFSFRQNERIYYDNRLCTVIQSTDGKLTLRRNADMRIITLTLEEYTQNPEILRQEGEKAPIKYGIKKPVFEEVDYIDEAWGV